MSIADAVDRLRHAIASIDGALAAVSDARVRTATSVMTLSAIATQSSNYLPQQAVSHATTAHTGFEQMARDLTDAKQSLERYIDEVTSGASDGLSPTIDVLVTRDLAFDRGALGVGFAPGAFRREEFEHEHERQTADHLADRHGANVQARPVDHTDGIPNPDAMVRWIGDDPGRVTEFKQMNESTYYSMRRNLWRAARQLHPHGGGDLVIDGRRAGMTQQFALDMYREAVAKARRKGKPVPDRTHVILADGSMITMREV